MVSDATIGGYDGPLEDWQGLRARALQRPDVSAAAPFVEGQGMAVAGESLAGVIVRGVDPELEREVSSINDAIREGSIDTLKPGSYAVLIGRSLAEALNVGVGDEIVLVLARSTSDAGRSRAASPQLGGSGHFRGGHVRIRPRLGIRESRRMLPYCFVRPGARPACA